MLIPLYNTKLTESFKYLQKSVINMGLESIIDKTKNFLVKGILMASIGLSGVAGCATIDSNNKAPTINLVNLSDTGCSKKTILMLNYFRCTFEK